MPALELTRLPYWRLGFLTLAAGTKPTMWAGPPYSIILAYATAKIDGCPHRNCHRIAYVNAAGWPHHLDCVEPDRQSDNLIVPSSFVAGSAETTAPTSFGLPDGGPLGSLLNEWRDRVRNWKGSWDSHYKRMGMRPLTTSVERWGEAYQSPVF